MMEVNDELGCVEGRGGPRGTGNRGESTGIQASKEIRSQRSFSIEDILKPDFGRNSENAKVEEELFISTDSVQSTRSLFPKLFGNLFNSRNFGDLTLFNRSLFSVICSESCSGANDELLGTKEPSLREREVNKAKPRDDLKCLSGSTTKSRNVKRSRKRKENAVDVVVDSLPSRTGCTPTGDRGCNEMKTVTSMEGQQHPVTIQEIPAWVYCTRYSDRPSAGRRTKRNKEATRRKNEKRSRTQFTGQQLNRLKAEFHANRYLTDERRLALADQLGLDTSQIKIWFQNRRANLKKSSGVRNVLAMKLMAEGLYNHALNNRNTQSH